MSRSGWVRCSKRLACPVCGKHDWCGVSGDGDIARCMRVPSDNESSHGWIHRLDQPLPMQERVATVSRQYIPPDEVDRMAREAYCDPAAVTLRRRLGTQLGVSPESLERLMVGRGLDGWLREYATFPAMDGSEQIIGIIRRFSDGKKLTVKGTRNSGVFTTNGWKRDATVYIVEGPTDVAAALDQGMHAIGRPSNTGGISAIVGLLRAHPARRLVVVGENDRKHDRRGTRPWCPANCSGCPWCFPGLYGARQTAISLAKHTGKSVVMLMPPPDYKDLRDWITRGQGKGL
jgi:hypothetical protein